MGAGTQAVTLSLWLVAHGGDPLGELTRQLLMGAG
jgi:hypothetical protein